MNNNYNKRRNTYRLPQPQFLRLAAIALLCISSSVAEATITAPSVVVRIDGGSPIEIPFTVSEVNPDIFEFKQDLSASGGLAIPGLAGISLHGTLDSDPSISYGLSVTDDGAPSTYSFTFSVPIMTIGFPNTVATSIAGAMVDLTGDGCSITPVGALVQVAELGIPSQLYGAVGPGFTYPSGGTGALYTYGAYATGPGSGPGPGPWTTLSLKVDFTTSGNGDVLVLAGFASIVPEPNSCCLLGIGFVGLMVGKRHRRNNR